MFKNELLYLKKKDKHFRYIMVFIFNSYYFLSLKYIRSNKMPNRNVLSLKERVQVIKLYQNGVTKKQLIQSWQDTN